MIYRLYKVSYARMLGEAGKCTLFLLLLYSFPANADTGFAKFAGEFLSTGVGARPLGMGGAFVALADDGTAGYWNPAGLSSLKYSQIGIMHAERFGGEVNYDYASVSVPYHPRRTLSFSLIRLGIDNIPDTRDALLDYGLDGIPGTGDEGEGNGILDPLGERLDLARIKYFSNADYAFFASFATLRSANFSYGGSIKLIRRAIGENSAFGIGFDVAARWRAGRRLIVGANLMDATSTLVAWDTGRKELISPTLKMGIAYPVEFTASQIRVTPVIDTDMRFENRGDAAQVSFGRTSMDFHYGVELQLYKRVYLRTGYDDIKRFTAGAGVYIYKFNIDYSFAAFDNIDELGDTHRISLTFSIYDPRFPSRK